jgi:hypothetical protein
MPLDPSEVRNWQEEEPEEDPTGNIHLHLHYREEGEEEGESEGEEEGEMEGEEMEGGESIEELCQQIKEIGRQLTPGTTDTRRRQHTRDSRAVPTSEISYVIPDPPPAERRRVIADGAEHLRQRTIGERALLNDFGDALSDHWDRVLEEDKRNRR